MRSKLFVPGSRPELFFKALAGQADALSFDLEDSVLETAKAEARRLVALVLQSPEAAASKKTLIVRVNGHTTPHFEADLAAVTGARLDLVNVPKVESADDILIVARTLARLEKDHSLTRPIGILANVESPRGLRIAAEIAGADPRVAGLQIGYADLMEPLGIDRGNAQAVQQIQFAVRLAAGEAGRWAFDAAYGAIKDLEGFRGEALAARRMGFIGKSCIHPTQIAVANEVFRPTDEEIAFARRVIETEEKTGAGAFTVDGRMIDAPFIKRARAVLAIAHQFPPGP